MNVVIGHPGNQRAAAGVDSNLAVARCQSGRELDDPVAGDAAISEHALDLDVRQQPCSTAALSRCHRANPIAGRWSRRSRHR